MIAEMKALWRQKLGNDESEYEDGVSFSEGWSVAGARAAVADGASTAFDAQSWVNLLVRRFVDPDGPQLEPESFERWLAAIQADWGLANERPTVSASVVGLYEEERAREGTCGTFLGLELGGLSPDGAQSWWRAVAIGDTVLFHLRHGQLVRHTPPLSAAEFSQGPALVHSSPDRCRTDCASLLTADGWLGVGDHLLVATDALAQWMLRRHERGASVWDVASALDHEAFHELVDELRSRQEIVNDDVTLLVIHLTDEPAASGGRSR